MKLRNVLFGKYREKVLCSIICNQIEKLINLRSKKKITILDYGSGYNPVVINCVIKLLKSKHKNITLNAYCYDYYTNEQIKKMNVNRNIKFFHVRKLRQEKIKKFDFCLLLDVLHHIGIDKNNTEVYKITNKLKKLSKFIFIKDHFQYGFFSNLVLILMDIVGNYADNVKIPNVYFSIKAYEDFITKLKMTEINRISDKSYYKWFWFYFNSKKFQFVSILK